MDKYLQTARDTMNRLADGVDFPPLFAAMGDLLCSTLAAGNKVLLAGNGGSAADCQHIAGELVVRFRKNRPALPAIALTVDTSVLTACLNDFGPEPVFARQVEALGRHNDIFWAFSTSGKSANILAACETARNLGMKTIGFTGETVNEFASLCTLCFHAPSTITSHIQECHITVGHMLCNVVEERLFP